MPAADRLRKSVERLESYIAGKALHKNRFKHFSFDIRNHPGELFHHFAAPAIRVDDGYELHFRSEGIGQIGA